MRYQCFKQLISTEAGLYSALTLRPAAGDAFLRHSLKEAARASTTPSSQQTQTLPFQRRSNDSAARRKTKDVLCKHSAQSSRRGNDHYYCHLLPSDTHHTLTN